MRRPASTEVPDARPDMLMSHFFSTNATRVRVKRAWLYTYIYIYACKERIRSLNSVDLPDELASVWKRQLGNGRRKPRTACMPSIRLVDWIWGEDTRGRHCDLSGMCQ